MIPRISRVSGLPRRRSSTSSFVTMALDEMPVAPAMTSASLVPQPEREAEGQPGAHVEDEVEAGRGEQQATAAR